MINILNLLFMNMEVDFLFTLFVFLLLIRFIWRALSHD